MKELRKDKMRLTHILEAIERLEKYAGGLTREELEADVLRYYGIVKNIEIIGEAARMLTDEFKRINHDVPWLSIANMRNFLVHEYFQVDSDTVWEVIHGDIVELKKYVLHYLSATDWKQWEQLSEEVSQVNHGDGGSS